MGIKRQNRHGLINNSIPPLPPPSPAPGPLLRHEHLPHHTRLDMLQGRQLQQRPPAICWDSRATHPPTHLFKVDHMWVAQPHLVHYLPLHILADLHHTTTGVPLLLVAAATMSAHALRLPAPACMARTVGQPAHWVCRRCLRPLPRTCGPRSRNLSAMGPPVCASNASITTPCDPRLIYLLSLYLQPYIGLLLSKAARRTSQQRTTVPLLCGRLHYRPGVIGDEVGQAAIFQVRHPAPLPEVLAPSGCQDCWSLGQCKTGTLPVPQKAWYGNRLWQS